MPPKSAHTGEKVRCPFCNGDAEWVENKTIYGKNYGKSYMMWICAPCDAYVGCHQNTKKPLGTLANKETRQWRMKAHEAFDPLWKKAGLQRREAYNFISNKLGREVHVGESNIEQCKEIIALCSPIFFAPKR